MPVALHEKALKTTAGFSWLVDCCNTPLAASKQAKAGIRGRCGKFDPLAVAGKADYLALRRAQISFASSLDEALPKALEGCPYCGERQSRGLKSAELSDTADAAPSVVSLADGWPSG